MEITNYAPVIIPTLCRYDKFVNCLESLEKCTGADSTDVYVALDFPYSKVTKQGWLLISEYLEKKIHNHRFKNLIVWKRDHNFGICHLHGNSETAIMELRKQYDRYIFSEDDNIFSPNFLEFLNKGLEKFKDDKRVLQISAYNYPFIFPTMYKNNFYITKNGSPWGFGGWYDRLEIIEKYADLNLLKQLLLDKSSLNKLRKDRPTAIASIINMLKSNKIYLDSVKGCCATFEDKYWILPTISKVKNTGNDGTGAHSTTKDIKTANYFASQEIDSEIFFEFTDDIFTYRPIEIGYHPRPINRYKEVYKKFVCYVDLFLLRYFNYLPKTKYI